MGKHATGYCRYWEKKRNWLVYVKDNGQNSSKAGMYCKLCQKHDMMPFGRDTWNRTPCRRLREESIVDHETSESHKKAEKKETIAALCGNVMERFQPAIPGDEVCAALSCLYFLCKNNMAYVTNFEPLLDLTTHLGLLIKDGIRVGKNAHYTSPGAIMEMLYALSGTIEKEVLDELRQSESYALMFDETTDCSVTEQMVIHCRFLDSKGKLQVRFLKVIDALVSADKSNTESVVSLNADVISKCVTDYIEQNQLDYGKSVIVSLDHEGEDRGDARAIGLHKMVTQFNFVATLLLLCCESVFTRSATQNAGSLCTEQELNLNPCYIESPTEHRG